MEITFTKKDYAIIQCAANKLEDTIKGIFPANCSFKVTMVVFDDPIYKPTPEFRKYLSGSKFLLSINLKVEKVNEDASTTKIVKIQRLFDKMANNKINIYHELIEIIPKQYRNCGIASAVLQVTDDISEHIAINRIFLEAGAEDGGRTWIKRGYVPYGSLHDIKLRQSDDVASLGFVKIFTIAVNSKFSDDANIAKRDRLLHILRTDDVLAFSDYALTTEFADNFGYLFTGSHWLGTIEADRFLLLRAAGYFTDPVQQTDGQKAAQLIVKSGLIGLAGSVDLVGRHGACGALAMLGLGDGACVNKSCA